MTNMKYVYNLYMRNENAIWFIEKLFSHTMNVRVKKLKLENGITLFELTTFKLKDYKQLYQFFNDNKILDTLSATFENDKNNWISELDFMLSEIWNDLHSYTINNNPNLSDIKQTIRVLIMYLKELDLIAFKELLESEKEFILTKANWFANDFTKINNCFNSNFTIEYLPFNKD